MNIWYYKSWSGALSALAPGVAGQGWFWGRRSRSAPQQTQDAPAAGVVFSQVLFKRHGETCTFSFSIYRPLSDSKRESMWNLEGRMIKEKSIQYSRRFISCFQVTLCMVMHCVQSFSSHLSGFVRWVHVVDTRLNNSFFCPYVRFSVHQYVQLFFVQIKMSQQCGNGVYNIDQCFLLYQLQFGKLKEEKERSLTLYGNVSDGFGSFLTFPQWHKDF